MAGKVYIVMGQTGEYSDLNEWPVAAFHSEAKAAERVAELDVWLRVNKFHSDGQVEWSWSELERIGKPQFDPNFTCDYTGTNYYLIAVEYAD